MVVYSLILRLANILDGLCVHVVTSLPNVKPRLPLLLMSLLNWNYSSLRTTYHTHENDDEMRF